MMYSIHTDCGRRVHKVKDMGNMVTAQYSEASIFRRFDNPKVSYSRLGLGLGNSNLRIIESSVYRTFGISTHNRKYNWNLVPEQTSADVAYNNPDSVPCPSQQQTAGHRSPPMRQ